ncbi:Caffeic acid 3-O-methyltransferase [Linum perenne]
MCLNEAVVEGGENAFYKAYGMKGMEYMKKDRRFSAGSNSELSTLVTETILERYSDQCFAGVDTLVDVGGGNGSNLPSHSLHSPYHF